MSNLNQNCVLVGPYQIRGCEFFGLPEEVENEGNGFAAHWRGRMKYIAQELGLLYSETRSGVQKSGHGHGHETLRLTSQDGSLIFEMDHVNYCQGPGYSCSYSHGPWYQYGEYIP